jgi:RNA polymerase sigma-70 factor (ECF subfamily)
MKKSSPERCVSDESSYVSLARGGDEAAWAEIVRRHGEAMFRLAYLMLGDGDEADDLAQEAFVRAYRALHTFDSSRPLRPWLLTIVSNLASNRLRSVRRYIAALRKTALSGVETVARLEDRTALEWEADTLWQAVRKLKVGEQKVIYMRYFLELTEAEMAAAMSVPHGTVKSRLHRALARLRDVVDREFPALREERIA